MSINQNADKEEAGLSQGESIATSPKEIKLEPRRLQSREEVLAKKAERLKRLKGEEDVEQVDDSSGASDIRAKQLASADEENREGEKADDEVPLVRRKRYVMSGGGVAPPSFSRRRRKSRKEKSKPRSKPSRSHRKSHKVKNFFKWFLRVDSLWLIPVAAVILIVVWQVLNRLPEWRNSAAGDSTAETNTAQVSVAPPSNTYGDKVTSSVDFAITIEDTSKSPKPKSLETIEQDVMIGLDDSREREATRVATDTNQKKFQESASTSFALGLSQPGRAEPSRLGLSKRCAQWLDERIVGESNTEEVGKKLADYVDFAVGEAAGRPDLLQTAYDVAIDRFRGSQEQAATAITAVEPLIAASLEAASRPAEIAAGHFLRGRGLVYAGQIDEAIGELKASLIASPTFAPSVQILYSLYSMRNDSEGIIRSGRSLLALAPGLPDVVLNVAMHLDATGRSSEALELIRANETSVAGHLQILALKVQAMRKLGTPPEQVLAEFEQHAPPYGDSLSADILLLVLKRAAGHNDGMPDRIQELARRVEASTLQNDTLLTRMTLSLAVLAAEYDLPEVSEPLYRAVIALGSQESALAANDFAYRLASSGERLEEAEALARSAIETFPNLEAFLDTLAVIYIKQGRPDKAVEVFDKRGLTEESLKNAEVRKTLVNARKLLSEDNSKSETKPTE